MTRGREARRRILGVCAALWILTACGDDDPAGPPDPPAVDLDALFAPPTAAEQAAVLAEWQSRDPAALDVRVETSAPVLLGLGIGGTARIVSHVVDGARHYGAIVTPDDAPDGELPVLLYAHGGDGGVRIEDLLLISFALGAAAEGFVYVVPSFRSETLRFGSQSWRSEGDASPWDRDVDDALALLDVALETTPAADPTRIAVLGLSRGGGVGLLMGIRDPRIDGVVEFFGPTDFFGSYVREIVEEALEGTLRDLPGLEVLNERYIQPLSDGELTIAEVRHQLVLRSAVYFAERLNGVQVHHGTNDSVVDVSQAERLIDVLQQLGRGAPAFEFHIYPGGEHNPLTMPGSPERTVEYLSALFSAPSAPRREHFPLALR